MVVVALYHAVSAYFFSMLKITDHDGKVTLLKTFCVYLRQLLQAPFFSFWALEHPSEIEPADYR